MIRSGRPDAWGAAAEHLAAGGEATEEWAATHLRPVEATRVTGRWAGAWVDLLDGFDAARVLLVEATPSRSARLIARRAGFLGVAAAGNGVDAFRRAWLKDLGAPVRVAPLAGLLAQPDAWDLIVVDGVAAGGRQTVASPRLIARLAGGLAGGGRVALIADNLLSPLRNLDHLAGRGAGAAVPNFGHLERSVRAAGMEVRQRFALLRSSAQPVTAFDLDASEATRAVLSAAMVRAGGMRAVALRSLARSRRPSLSAALVPAWMVVASAADGPWENAPDRPTGRIGYADDDEVKVVRGEPPVQLEKRYLSDACAQNEAMALRALAAADVGLVPRPVGAPLDLRARLTWLPGRPLSPKRLGLAATDRFAGRAARVLADLHQATARADGRVLVHGDYWLGNLLEGGGAIVGVVDWTDAHWGEPEEDVEHLVATLVKDRSRSSASSAWLRSTVRRQYAEGRAQARPAS